MTSPSSLEELQKLCGPALQPLCNMLSRLNPLDPEVQRIVTLAKSYLEMANVDKDFESILLTTMQNSFGKLDLTGVEENTRTRVFAVLPTTRRGYEFVGRDIELEQMESGSNVMLMIGEPGVGKSALAMEFCELQQSQYGREIFWFEASSNTHLLHQYRMLAIESMILSANEAMLADWETMAITLHRSLFAIKPCILVYDHVQADTCAVQVLPPVPIKGSPAVFIFTTNHRDWSHVRSYRDELLIDPLSEMDAMVLMQQCSKRLGAAEKKKLLQLIKRADRKPLALTLAGALLAQNVALPVELYLKQLERGYDSTLYGAPSHFDMIDRLVVGNLRALGHILEDNAREMLAILSCFAYDSIPATWFLQGSTREEMMESFRVAVEQLVVMRLVMLSDGCNICLHPAVVEVVRRRYVNAAVYQQVINLVLKNWDFDIKEPQNWCLSMTTAVHVEEIVRQVAPKQSKHLRTEGLGEVCSRLSFMFLHTGGSVIDQAQKYYKMALKYGGPDLKSASPGNELALITFGGEGEDREPISPLISSIELYEKALRIQDHVLPANDSETLDTVTLLAAMHAEAGNHDRAATLYERALDMQRATNASLPNISATMNELGVICYVRGQLDRALELFDESVRLEKSFDNIDNDAVATTLSNKATVMFTLGNTLGALDSFEQAVLIDRTLPVSTKTMVTWNNLALLQSVSGEHDDAFKLYTRSLAEMPKLGASDADLAFAQNQLGSIYVRRCDYRMALSHYQQALDLVDKGEATDDPFIAIICVNIGLLHDSATGDYVTALAMLERALKIYEAHLGEDHWRLATLLNDIASVHQNRMEFAKALSCYERALRILKQHRDEAGVSLAPTFNNMALACESLGEADLALNLLTRAFETLQEDPLEEVDHTAALFISCNMASLLIAKGNFQPAMNLLTKCNVLNEAMGDYDHLVMARVRHHSALIHYEQGEYTLAMMLLQESMQMVADELGYHHGSIASSLNNMAMVLVRQEDLQSAWQMLEQALLIVEKLNKTDYPDGAKIVHNMGYVLQLKAEHDNALWVYKNCLEVKTKAIGKHPSVAVTLINMAVIQCRKNEAADALLVFEQALRIVERVYGLEHRLAAVLYLNLANAHVLLRHFTVARELYEHSQQIKLDVFGSNHHSIKIIHNNLAAIKPLIDAAPKAPTNGDHVIDPAQNGHADVDLPIPTVEYETLGEFL